MTYLLDTSVFSQPLRRKPMELTLLRWKNSGDRNCLVSRVTVAEVECGLHLEKNELRWAKYRALLDGRLTILETTEDIWRRFAVMKARQQKLGQPVADLDLIIAATASHHNLIVATLNRSDFSRIEGLAWEDWAIA